MAEHVEPTEFLGRGMRHLEVLFGRSPAADLKSAVLFVETTVFGILSVILTVAFGVCCRIFN